VGPRASLADRPVTATRTSHVGKQRGRPPAGGQSGQRWRGARRIARQNEASGEPKPTPSLPTSPRSRGPRPAGSSKAKREGLTRRRAQVEQWISEERSPIREVELIQQRLDIDAQLAQIDQAARLPELEEAFVNVAASWAKRSGISGRRCARWAYPQACSGGLACCEREEAIRCHFVVTGPDCSGKEAS
jgi:hypothetical protein